VPAALHMKLDELCDTYGMHNIRATTRQAYQLHGVMKSQLKTVILLWHISIWLASFCRSLERPSISAASTVVIHFN
jgi:hypothetical protein